MLTDRDRDSWASKRSVLKNSNGWLGILDLMLAESKVRQPLGPISVNGRNRKRKWAPREQGKDNFTVEVQALRASLTQQARALIFVDSMR